MGDRMNNYSLKLSYFNFEYPQNVYGCYVITSITFTFY